MRQEGIRRNKYMGTRHQYRKESIGPRGEEAVKGIKI